MTAVVVVAIVLGLVLLTWGVVLLARAQRRLTNIERLLADQPSGLSVEDATLVAEAAARHAADAVARAPLAPVLTAGDTESDPGSPPRRSDTRIKASGWAAGASEAVRRLREGA